MLLCVDNLALQMGIIKKTSDMPSDSIQLAAALHHSRLVTLLNNTYCCND